MAAPTLVAVGPISDTAIPDYRQRRSRREPCRYDRGSGDVWLGVIGLDVICSCGFATIRLQMLAEQKNLPSAHASTRSEFALLIAIVP